MTVHSPAAVDNSEEPPPPESRVLVVGLIGVGLVFAALVFGLVTEAPRRGFDIHWADGPRALLACLGLLVVGCAVSMRPKWFGGWLCGAVAGLLGYGLGMPRPAGTEWHLVGPRDWFAGVANSWDSVQLFFGIAAAIGLVGAIWTMLPRRAALSATLLGTAFHFAGILSAVTSPAPTPFLTDHYWRRVASPYLQFTYMNNAYQFYSPDPGPACELWVCVESKPREAGDDPDVKKECVWEYTPRRNAHFKDPLGLSYYRRLSLTENVAQYQQRGYRLPAPEATAVEARRRTEFSRIPPYGFAEVQRVLPNNLITRQVLPSYARHIAHAHERPDREITSIRIYRTLHNICPIEQFIGYDSGLDRPRPPKSPYDPGLYMPYFQGEFDTNGALKDPQAPLLYWLVPIVEIRTPESPEKYREPNGYQKYFTDYVSIHAGCKRPVE